MCNRMERPAWPAGSGNGSTITHTDIGRLRVIHVEQICGDYIFRCVYRNGRLFENDKVMG